LDAAAQTGVSPKRLGAAAHHSGEKESVMNRCASVDFVLKAAAVILLGGSLAAGVASVSAGPAGGGQAVNRDRNGLAIDGYDPVAYFAEGRPVRGVAEFEHTWNGTKYRFVSAANRDRFAKDPEAFAPQYGGFCSYAVSRGYTADIDPLAWAVVDGKLYLNYSVRVQRTWETDVPGNIRKADANWVTLRDKGK
jgi:YHS domain-containing protein